MRIELAGGSIKRLVSVWRDVEPLPGEKPPKRIAVDQYGWQPTKVVASVPVLNTPRWQQYLVDKGHESDRLLAALKDGPVKPKIKGDRWVVDLDRIERPTPTPKV